MLLKDLNEEHHHDSSVSSVTLSEKHPIVLEVFRRKIGELLWESQSDTEIYRIKGVVNMQGSDKVSEYYLRLSSLIALRTGVLLASSPRNIRARSL